MDREGWGRPLQPSPLRQGSRGGPGTSKGGRLGSSCTGGKGAGGSQRFPSLCVNMFILPCFQEPDYGALYEGRNPGFYVEANPMPTFKVQPWAFAEEAGEAAQLLGACMFLLRAHLWSLWRSGDCGFLRPEGW